MKDIEAIKREVARLVRLGWMRTEEETQEIEKFIDKAVSQTIKMVLACKPEEKDKEAACDDYSDDLHETIYFDDGYEAGLAEWQAAINKLKDKI